MTVHWNVNNDHLISRWSNGESTPKYDSDWLKEFSAHEGRRRAFIVDITLLSPFGGARWYTYAPYELERAK